MNDCSPHTSLFKQSRFVLPLPSPDQLHCSKEIAFFENVMPEQDTTNEFNSSLCAINENSPKKAFQGHREYCVGENESESSFLCLLQYMTQAKIDKNKEECLLLIGGQWKAAQFVLLNQLYPRLEIHLWASKVQNASSLPAYVKRKHGFPSFSTYEHEKNVHLFSEFRSPSSFNIMNDLNTQMRVVENCKPKTASLRFRPPFRKDHNQDSITYFAGEMQTICYGAPSSIATRIFLRRPKRDLLDVQEPGFALVEKDSIYAKKTYALVDFEQAMNYYNTEVRSIKKWTRGSFTSSFDDCYRQAILEDVLEVKKTKEVAIFWQNITHACRSLCPKL